jgi:hypothetical protein
MKKSPKSNSPDDLEVMPDDILDKDITGYLAEAQLPETIPEVTRSRLRGNLLDQIAREAAGIGEGYTTVRANEGEWVEALPGAEIKILYQMGDDGPLSYLARLAAGFEMPGHVHDLDEECIMLEGDLAMGDIYLEAGDYHFSAKGMNHGKHRTKQGALIFLRGALPI